ncbi:aminotransferase-like domain-containing protein [Paramaledivibacter caminithermalis]|jgi:2-aminoadipate transaminase|uniref:2-aminoadipate transaminase n=1 Tax=Paramaledivibacter caminithermalis (strain DSM 15212 / CIP 107654 / DViRD3) TaxID=1121301 RepID=A0A1M6NDE1_PARC5|nr:PLP-dependent aminotransferase family protein [Paramaledivibacter caminithermalis]SHJ93663.1 2-aminoadipate transaminase [Paramaledivibacter caminithermalis DSM 15212]
MAIKYSDRMQGIKASEIRELLKLTVRPEVISFAGGLPAPEVFPVEEMKKVSLKVLEEKGQQALQYSPTEGFPPLREKIAQRMSRVGIEVTANNILITNGSQQGLDFSGKIFLNPDDAVIVESPSYLGAINAFKAYQCKFIEVPTDDNGMLMDELEEALKNNKNAKMIYVIPDFQNPSGRTWSLERRKKLVELANKYDLPIIEDNPYGELRFEGERIPAIKSMDTEGRVVFLGTFSKTFSPGLRIGWVCASDEILNKYILVKQGADLQSNSMSQRELDAFLEIYDLDEHIEKIKKLYRGRRNLMFNTMKEFFPPEVKHTYPEGGLFTWVVLPKHINARELLKKALERNVAFVPGGAFFPNGGNENTMRINYSNMPEERIVEGIKILGEVIKEALNEK